MDFLHFEIFPGQRVQLPFGEKDMKSGHRQLQVINIGLFHSFFFSFPIFSLLILGTITKCFIKPYTVSCQEMVLLIMYIYFLLLHLLLVGNGSHLTFGKYYSLRIVHTQHSHPGGIRPLHHSAYSSEHCESPSPFYTYTPNKGRLNTLNGTRLESSPLTRPPLNILLFSFQFPL